jgi:hypothetical protein
MPALNAAATQRLPTVFAPSIASCSRLYIDVGLNIGDNIRALYDRQVASASRKLNRTLGSVFGDAGERGDVCTVGLEPNPIHSARLMALQRALRARGHNVQIFGVAVSNASGHATYWACTQWLEHRTSNVILMRVSRLRGQNDQAAHNVARHGWGSSLLRWAGKMDEAHAVQVPTLTLHDIVRALFYPEPSPHTSPPPPRLVGMKVDCEGCEYDAIPPALEALCDHVDVLWLERHDRFFSKRWRGHLPGFDSLGRVKALDRSLRKLSTRVTPCRMQVRTLSTTEVGRRRL